MSISCTQSKEHPGRLNIHEVSCERSVGAEGRAKIPEGSQVHAERLRVAILESALLEAGYARTSKVWFC